MPVLCLLPPDQICLIFDSKLLFATWVWSGIRFFLILHPLTSLTSFSSPAYTQLGFCASPGLPQYHPVFAEQLMTLPVKSPPLLLFRYWERSLSSLVTTPPLPQAPPCSLRGPPVKSFSSCSAVLYLPAPLLWSCFCLVCSSCSVFSITASIYWSIRTKRLFPASG